MSGVARSVVMAMASKLLPPAAAAAAASVSSVPVSCKLGPSRLPYALQRCRLGFSIPGSTHAFRSLPRQSFTTVSSALAEPEQQEQTSPPQHSCHSMVDTRMPITVITGFLGAGKTTLLNRILTANHGIKIAVIENEFGEVGIDGSLVAAQEAGTDDIILLNNGCLCCTVRGDLVRMLAELIDKRRKKLTDFDHILIETTGLANPAPIIQTFYVEETVSQHVRLDGVVTMVDAKHVLRHIEEVKPEGVANEAVEQIAYADRIILNKIDLVGEAEQDELISKIKRINRMAQIEKTTYGGVAIDYVMGVGGFDLERVEDIVEKVTAKPETDGHCKEDHVHDEQCGHGHDHKHEHGHDHGHKHSHDHVHDPGVSSVSIVCEGLVDLTKINEWMEGLLKDQGDNIYRMKGVLAIEGFDERYVFQGVHSMFEGGIDRLWKADEDRTNKLVFIGQKLDEESLRSNFKKCMFAESTN